MTILYILHTDGFGGANRSFIQLLKGLNDTRQLDHKYVLTPFEEDEIVPLLEDLGCTLIPADFGNCTTVLYGIRESVRYYLKAFKYSRIYDTVKDLGIDIVHTNTSVCDLGAYLAKRLKVPHIWHVRERMDYYKMSVIRPFHYRRQIESRNTTVVCISKYIENYIKDRFGGVRSRVVYNCIDINDHSKGSKSDDGIINLVIAGIIVRNKGIEDAIGALDIIVNEYDIRNIRLYIVGTSTDTSKYENELKRMVSGYDLDDNVVFMPFFDEIDKIRAKCDIALQCSIMEGLGRVTIEAMLDDLLVIGARSGATIELIKEGFNGWLYEPGDSKDLAEKIRYVINLDEKTGDLIRHNAYKWAKETFSTDRISRQIMDIYENAIDQKV